MSLLTARVYFSVRELVSLAAMNGSWDGMIRSIIAALVDQFQGIVGCSDHAPCSVRICSSVCGSVLVRYKRIRLRQKTLQVLHAAQKSESPLRVHVYLSP
jgi:predicted nucleic acid-binding Zn ribbon protein